MNRIKIIKRVLLWFGLIFIVTISSGIIFSIVYKDDIIGYFIKESNKYITTPIEVGKIEISIFNHFPNISINLQNVIVKEGTKDHLGILGKAKTISFSFNPIDIYYKNYTISGIYFSDAEVNLRVDEEGMANYLFYKKDSLNKNGGVFSLQNIKAENIKIDYLDVRSDYHVAFFIKNAQSELTQSNNLLNVSAKGEMVSDEIKVGDRKFFDNKEILIKTDFEYDLQNKVYEFTTGKLVIDQGEFEVLGLVNVNERNLDMKFNGINTSFQTINSLLSNDLSRYFKEYKSNGEAYFSGVVSGGYGGKLNPQVTLEFGAKSASFFHPKYKKQIKDVNLTGHFSSGKNNSPINYRLDLKNFSCRLEEKMLEGSLVLQNFNDYDIDLILKGEVDVNSLLLLFPRKYVKTAFGNLKLDVHVNGKLQNPTLTRNIQANGEVDLQNISFVLTGEKLPFNKLNGSLALRNNDLAISDFSGYVGKSDFRINGFIKDISKIILTKNKSYKLQADFKSKHLDFDELLKSNFASRDTTSNKNSKYEFTISPTISLDLNCDIDHLNFKRFRGESILGQIEINREVAYLKNISFTSMGGRVNISGSVNSRKENLIEVWSDANLYNINIDSVFYVFKNFNQDWLVDKNLKGQLDADVNLFMTLNKNLILNSKSMVANINTSITNGELNNFEPIMKLSKFVEEESLANMRFAHMTNEIRIENRIIYLPEMEIKSNVSNILISGTHTFDKDIDYHLSVPLKSFIRISKKKDFTQSARNGMNLLLKITGNTSDYTISYDSQALKEKFISSFSDEGEEWKKIKKGEPVNEQSTPELEEEYFDFDEDDSSHE